MSRACDLIVSGGLFFLLLFTPFAFGSVHPWAYIIAECVVFVMVVTAMVKITLLDRWPGIMGPWSKRLALPLAFFLALVGFQILPLPPALVEFLSPQAFQLYQRSLPGWPDEQPFTKLLNASPGQTVQPQILPTPEQVRQGWPIPFGTGNQRINGTTDAITVTGLLPTAWRPLSLAAPLGRVDLLKFLAYAALFFLILLYPFGPTEPANASVPVERQRAEVIFFRSLLILLLICGFAVALVGVIQLFAGNGKILWLLTPYDWDIDAAKHLNRASGPFVNPDHFANYLTVIFPFALAFTLKPPRFFSLQLTAGLRIGAALTVGTILLALLLTLSRFGWLGALIGFGIWFLYERPNMPALGHRPLWIGLGVGLCALLVVTILWLVGPSARASIDQRLAETVSDDVGLGSRPTLWRDTLSMIGDYPLLGAGLGSWSDLYPRYQSPASTQIFYREAHNDFIELIAEVGFFGFVLLAAFFVQGARLMQRSLPLAPPDERFILVPCVAATIVMISHELVDFNLQIPANAILFTILFGAAARLSLSILSQQRIRDSELRRWVPLSVGASALGLIAWAFTQDPVPYPHNISFDNSVAHAIEHISRHPAQAIGQVHLAQLVGERTAPQTQSQIYATAKWLHPNHPGLRDLYASSLLRAGQRDQGLKELRESVALAPSMTRHFYLSDAILPWLPVDEQRAIEDGFALAQARGDAAVLKDFAAFYEHTGRHLESAQLLESSAARAADSYSRFDALIGAAESYLHAQQLSKGEELYRKAAQLRPQDPRPYQAMALSVFAVQNDPDRIAAVIDDGLQHKADAVPLLLTLAEAMQRAGARDRVGAALLRAEATIAAALDDTNVVPTLLALADSARKLAMPDRERAALEQALELRPYAVEVLQPLGSFYLHNKLYDRAAFIYARLTEVQPNSAIAFHQLGRAEEERFGLAAAADAYARAVALAPNNPTYREHHEALKAQLALNRKAS